MASANFFFSRKQRDLDFGELGIRRWRGRLDGGFELLFGLVELSRAAQQVGLEQEPEAGEPGFARGFFEQVERFGLARLPAGRAGRLEPGAVGEGLGQPETEVVAQGRVIASAADRSKPLDRVVERRAGFLARLGIAGEASAVSSQL